MSRNPTAATKARAARQTAGLALATPKRARLDVDRHDFARLSPAERRRADRPARGLILAWSPVGEDPLDPTAWRSSPIDHANLDRVRQALVALGLDPVLRPALCWAHLAVVRYVDGSRVALGCERLPLNTDEAEAGFPIARLEGRRVLPWMGRLHGHTDAEVLAAPEFVRGRTIADGAVGAEP